MILHVPAEALREMTMAQLLSGLNARLDISDKSGSNVATCENSVEFFKEETTGGAVPIFHLSHFGKGTYQATITVMDGAPALRGISQHIEGQYQLCGLERMPATFLNGVGIASVGIGCVLGAIVALKANTAKPL